MESALRSPFLFSSVRLDGNGGEKHGKYTGLFREPACGQRVIAAITGDSDHSGAK